MWGLETIRATIFASRPVALLEETRKIVVKAEMAGTEKTPWRTPGSSHVVVNAVRCSLVVAVVQQNLRGKGEDEFS